MTGRGAPFTHDPFEHEAVRYRDGTQHKMLRILGLVHHDEHASPPCAPRRRVVKFLWPVTTGSQMSTSRSVV